MKRNWLRTIALFGAWIPALGMAAQVTPEQARAAKAILGAPENEAAGKAWGVEYRVAMQQRLRSFAASGEPRRLYVAGLLWDAISDKESGGTDSSAPSAQARAWLQAAVDARPRDALVARYEIDYCPQAGLRCDPAGALESLLRSEPDNAEVQLRAMVQASQRSDEAAAESRWQGAASATRFDGGATAFGRAVMEVYDGLAWPMPNARLSKVTEQLREQGLELDFRALALMAGQQLWVIRALPAASMMQGVQDRCGEPPANTPRWDECMSVSGLMAADGSNLLVPTIGLRKLVRLTEADARSGWERRLLDIQWLQRAVADATLEELASTAAYQHLGVMLREGELPALRRLQARRDIAATPPPGWTPGNGPMVDSGGGLIITLPDS